MNLAGKLQLKPGQSVAIVNQPEDAQLDLGEEHPPGDDPDRADAIIAFSANREALERAADRYVGPARPKRL